MLNKETFCEIIELLRQQILFDNESAENIQRMFGVAQKCRYKNNYAIKALMKLLNLHLPKDEEGFCRIEHYCFYLEFGKMEDGIITPEELYDSLTKPKI
jgi:hypothetical protein